MQRTRLTFAAVTLFVISSLGTTKLAARVQWHGQDAVQYELRDKKVETLSKFEIFYLSPEGHSMYSVCAYVESAVRETVKAIRFEPEKAKITALKKRLQRLNAFLESNTKLNRQLAAIDAVATSSMELLGETFGAPDGSSAASQRLRAEKPARLCIKNYEIFQQKIPAHFEKWQEIQPEVREILKTPE